MKTITEKLLRIDHHACEEGYQWWLDHNKPTDVISTTKSLAQDNHFDWANWLIVRFMNHDQKIKYAIYAAEQVVSIYEKNIQMTIGHAKRFKLQKII